MLPVRHQRGRDAFCEQNRQTLLRSQRRCAFDRLGKRDPWSTKGPPVMAWALADFPMLRKMIEQSDG